MSTTKPTSLITFLLDRSDSMRSCKEATIEGFNGYVNNLQTEPDAAIDFTFLQFDNISLDKVCVAIPISDAQLLTETTYQPRGGTPLIECSIKTINAVAESLKKRSDTPKVVICIQTDGQENCSGPEYTWEALRALIADKTALGWQFNFLGAGIDAYDQGAKMGIAAESTMSYDSTDRVKTRHAFAASASNAGNFASGRMASTAYSVRDRTLSGDTFAPSHLGGVGRGPSREAAKLHGLDLTTTVTTQVTATVTDDLIL